MLKHNLLTNCFKQKFSAQFEALIDENTRRRDECIQLRTILADRSQTLKLSTGNDEHDLSEALQAQKLVNRYGDVTVAI